jgi:Fe2+ transport system protein FeoA
VTGYVHREVAIRQINKGESIEIVQKYNPDKLDYYRADVNNLLISLRKKRSAAIEVYGRIITK